MTVPVFYLAFSGAPVRRDDVLIVPPAIPTEAPADGRTNVGIWDLDARVGFLGDVVRRMNEAQDRFAFYEVLAVVPAGLISTPDRVRAWASERFEKFDAYSADLVANVIAEDFFEPAEVVRSGIAVDHLVGLTASMIAFEDDENVYYNYFATADPERPLGLASTYDVARLARVADRRYEVAVAGIMLAIFLAGRYEQLEFHENRGCLFDFNGERETIAESFERCIIETECLDLIPETDRRSVEELVKVLGGYPRLNPETGAGGETVERDVAVVVPGIMGSELRLGEELIWPGPVHSLFTAYEMMNELLDDRLVATDVIRRYTYFSRQYETLLDDLATCGFREDDDPPTLYTCPYDWRRANEVSAEVLAKKLDEIAEKHGKQVKVSLIAHSMSGLIARYYLESGDFGNRPGCATVCRLITLATPHRGAAVALARVLGLESVLWLSGDQVRILAGDERFPSAYQLLPPVGEPFAWDFAATTEYGPVDIYEPAHATALGLVECNLLAATAFHEKLGVHLRPRGVRYFCFSGTHQKTTASARIRRRAPDRYDVENWEVSGGGDGTVPTWSGALPGLQSLAVGGEHGTIYKDGTLRRALATLLGKMGVLAAEPLHVDVALRDPVARPDDPVHVALGFGAGMGQIDGQLRVEFAQLVDEKPIFSVVPGSPTAYPVRYQGLTAETIAVVFDAPKVPGEYRVAFFPENAVDPAGSDVLIVQKA